MTVAIKRNFKFALATPLAASAVFWFNMEDYQKDRFATLIVRSVIDTVDQSAKPEATGVSETRQGLKLSHVRHGVADSHSI